MRFANILPHTKAGNIWDAAKEGPNYLGDPKIVDPAGISCVTSALGGKNVPLLWFKLRKIPNRIWHNCLAPRMSRFHYGGYVKITELMNRAFQKFHNLDYLTKFDVVLVNVSVRSFREMAMFVTAARKLRKRPIIVGAIDSTFGDFRNALRNKDNFKYFKIFLDKCDVFMTYYIHEAIADYLKFYTDTPIVHVPQVYPFEFAKSFYQPHEKKEKIIFVSGHSRRVDDIFSLLVAKKIQRAYHEFSIEMIRRPLENIEPLKGAGYKLVPPTKWQDYLKYSSKTYMIIDMDTAWTWGRVASDAAAVGTPCIGLNSGAQSRLFPDLTCSDITDANKVFGLATKLIENRKFYEMVQRKAFKKLEEYSYGNFMKHWKLVLEAARK